MTGTIFDVKEMAVHDGPGIRTTIFLKGCPLRCRWCHNPEGLSFAPQLMYKEARCKKCNQCQTECAHESCRPFGRCIRVCPENCLEISGRYVEAGVLCEELRRAAAVMGDSFGGFTFSGGEPLAQPGFLMALLEELEDYHLCIETSGYAHSSTFRAVIEKLDLVIMDIKLADSKQHKQYTGVGNEQILQNLGVLKESGKPHMIRTPLIPGITDTLENLNGIKEIIGSSPWEKLPYNQMAGAKYKMLGMEYSQPTSI